MRKAKDKEVSLFWKLTNWYFTRQALPYWSILAMDLAIVFLSGIMAYMVSHGAYETLSHMCAVASTLGVYLFVFALMFRIFHTYSNVLRYSSFIDLWRVMLSIFLGVVVIFVARHLLPLDEWFYPISARTLMCAGLLSMLLIWVVRMAVKHVYDEIYTKAHAERAMVYGTKAGGVSLAKGLANQSPSPYTVRGFISDDPQMKGRILMGKKVWLRGADTAAMLRRMNVRALLVSPLKLEVLRSEPDFIEQLVRAGVAIMVMPQTVEWDGKGDLSYMMLRHIDLEDVLPRDPIQVDLVAIGKMLRGKSVLVTGAAGSIGAEIVRQVARFRPKHLTLVDQAETPMHDMRLMMNRDFPLVPTLTVVTSITKTRQMETLFAESRPDYVFHAAAYKHVPMMEDNPGNAIQNNCRGTRVVADLSVKYGVKKFVMISTDKAVNPTNVMGCTKRICEIYVQSLGKAIHEGKVKGVTQFVTTRFGNVLGSNGSVIPLFREQINHGGPVTVTHPNIVRYFMLIPEACRLVLEAGTMGKGGEIFVFDMGKPVRIADLAQRMIDLSGAKGVEIEYTGLRDGEKLYEEVLSDQEHTLPTPNPKIRVASVREYDYEEICRHEDELLELSYTYDNMAIVQKMKEIVPEYKSRNSVYERLDK